MNRRKAPFRYRLVRPFDCLFKITRINSKQVSSNKDAKTSLADVSKFGCKIVSELDLNTQVNQIEVLLSLEIPSQPEPITLTGTVQWQAHEDSVNYYGIKFANLEEDKDSIMSVLKTLASTNQIKLI